MEVILLSDVDKVGLRGEVVNVARGYARNFLLPRKLAEPATAGRVAELKRLDDQRARHEARSVDQANEIADVLRKTVLSFDVKSGPTGALFGSVTTTDIADELWRTRKIRVDRKKIGTDSIRRIGRYSIPIQIFEDVTVEVKTLVVPEGGELPPEEELAAMEAAEAEAEAAKEAEAEAHRAEAEEILEAELAAEEEAAAETEVAGHTFCPGETVLVNFAAANRDPREFDEPDRCILDRQTNRHLGFGAGAHRCLGSNLARMEFRVGLERVLARMPDFVVPPDADVEFRGNTSNRGYTHVPVTFTPGPRVG